MQKLILLASIVSSCSRGPGSDITPLDSGIGADAAPTPGGDLPAFPGAEGFGAFASGGRGGEVCHVTSLAHDGPGTLQDCVSHAAPTTVVFEVSGVIAGPVQLARPVLTSAGQTSPGGVTIRGGLICDNIYEPGSDCRNLIIRHVRVRDPESDTLRLGGTQDVIVDHCSFGNARDESIELTRSQRVTVQYSVIAEPIGDHYRWGGVLLNYSTAAHPLGKITLHHDVWNGVFGRLPEISCEENNDAPGSNCAGHVIELDLASNLLFDASDPIWHNRCTGNNEGNDCAPATSNVQLALNWTDNVMYRRTGASDAPMIEPSVTRAPASEVFYTGNRLYDGAAGAYAALDVASRGARHDFPAVTATAAANLVAVLRDQAGAFPRDPMDVRLASYLASGVDARPLAWASDLGIDRGDGLALVASPPAVPADGDRDGMPDAWETDHGLDPAMAGAAATTLASRPDNGIAGCTAGYTDLECYLDELAVARLPR